ncbi:MAG: viologen exporter family transport system permease protein [Actinomycetota bacterium]
MVELWLRLAHTKLRAEMQYRTSFVLVVAMTFVFSFLDFAAVWVIFANLNAMAGWTFADVALLYGTSGVSFNLANVLVAGVDVAAAHIRAGTFDILLLRPVGTIVQLSAADIELKRVGRVAQGAVILVVAMATVDVTWTPVRLAMLGVILVAGFAIFGAIWVVAASLGFWTVDNRQIANSVTYAGNKLTQFPLDVFAGWLRGVVLLLPLAFVNYLPIARLLGKDDAYGLPSWFGFASPIVAVVLAVAARGVWSFAIRHHRSTGS